MLVTVLAAVMMMAAYFLILYAGVGFIQDKRFIAMLYLLEIYDILFFDWVLLCHSGFFPHFYPEMKGVVGPHMFGYNKRAHILTSRSIFPPARFLRACTCSFSAFRAGIPPKAAGVLLCRGGLSGAAFCDKLRKANRDVENTDEQKAE